jgi:hypothetical protein
VKFLERGQDAVGTGRWQPENFPKESGIIPNKIRAQRVFQPWGSEFRP